MRLAIFFGKTIFSLSRFLQIGGGSAAPGLYSLKIDPNIVEKLTKKIPQNIIITGTNGKTTTARMLTHFAKQAGLRVVRNHTGSNLERGIASSLIQNFPKKFDLGIWEMDEAAFNIVAPKLNPALVIFLNVSRDQLDRYGEVDKVVNDWCNTLSKLDPKTLVLINQDDKNLVKLEKYFPGKVVKFGKKNINNIKLKGLSGSEFQISDIRYQISVPGLYHIYDAAAAIIGAKLLNIPTRSLKGFSPAFGRVEKFTFKPQGLNSFKPQDNYIFLIKNPAGATQVFETIAPELKKNDRLLLALNDNLADGTDVSWIWDADFEKLKVKNQKSKVIASGIRAYDLANRLKYAGFNPNNIMVEQNLEKAFKLAGKGLKGRLFILPTYTAMLELQKILARSGVKKHYWEE